VTCSTTRWPRSRATLGITDTAAKGALQRARATLGRHLSAEPAPAPASAQEQDLGRRFAEALTGDDIDGLVALLSDDAWLAMPPAPHEYHGSAAITAFLRAFAAYRGVRRFHVAPTRANGQPAFGCYLDRPGEPAADAAGLFVLTLSGDAIAGLTWFLEADLQRHFGLPGTLSAGSVS
jgi:RNA polymerase sigma-70 factor (ECF subfamily)